MSLLGRYLNRYRIFWLTVLAAFALFMYWLLFVKPANPLFTEVDPREVRTTAIEDFTEKEPTIGERAGPLQLSAEGAELSVSSSDGELIMRLWAKSAVKDGPVFTVDEGVLQFVMSGGSVLVVRVESCVFRNEEDLLTVSGDVTGNIRGTGQYFAGKQLRWDRNLHVIAADEVSFVGPNIEVRGEQMEVDLRTGQVRFDGPVEAGV